MCASAALSIGRMTSHHARLVSGIDNHPEVFGPETPPPAPEPKAQRGPQMTDFIRKVLGRPRRPTAQQAQSELHRLRIMRRIERQGF